MLLSVDALDLLLVIHEQTIIMVVRNGILPYLCFRIALIQLLMQNPGVTSFLPWFMGKIGIFNVLL